MEDILGAYYSFQLKFLPIEWVDCVWKSNLSEDRKIPEEYNEHIKDKDCYCLMQELTVSIENWLNSSGESTSTQICERNWVALSSKIDHRALICFLSTFVRTNTSEVFDATDRKLACAAFRLYVNLLKVPGANLMNIFNPILFGQMLEIVDSVGSFIKSTYIGKQSKKGEGKPDESQADEDDSENTVDSSTSTDSVLKEMLHEICLLLQDMSTWLTRYNLIDEPNTLLNIIKTLVELTLLEQERNVLENCTPEENTPGFIALYSYNILEQLCIPQHGDVSNTVLAIMKCLLHHLVIDNLNSKVSVNEYGTVKEHTYSFIKKILRTVGIENAPGIKAAVQQLCIHMPGRSDLRAKVASDIVSLLKEFPSPDFKELVLWIVSFAHSSTVEYRINGIELISRLLNIGDETETSDSCGSDKSKGCGGSLDTESCLVRKLLLATIIGKCSDSSTLVRCKCLAIFANIIISNQPHIKKLVREIFIASDGSGSSLQNEKSFNLVTFLNQDAKRLELPTDPLPSGAYVINFIERLVFDKNVFVRKSALQVLLNACILDQKWITTRRLKLFTYHCRDRSVLIRDVLSKCLTDLIRKYPNNMEVVRSWVEGLIPLINDNETKDQEKVIEYIGKVIIRNIVPYGEIVNPLFKLPWLVLTEIFKKNMRGPFRFVCQHWSLQGTVKKPFFRILLSHIGTENNLAVWFLIVSLTEFQDFPFPNEICNYFLKNVYSASTSNECLHQLVSEALFFNWRKLSGNTKDELYRKLRFSVENFSVPIYLISRRMDICFQYNKAETIVWCQKLIKVCEENLRKNLRSNSTNLHNDEAVCIYIYTLGDAAHYSPGVSCDVIDLLAKLIDPENQDATYFKKKAASIRGKISAVSIVTLGKLCLQDVFLAKQYVPDLVNLLSKPSLLWDTIKINTMVALSDICVRFTSVVENYLGKMFVTLKDPSIEVRKNSLTLVTQLMQDNYLKISSPLFFYIMMMILDSSAEIRQTTESFIVNSIVKKRPGVMSQFFLKAIFFFNNYEGMQGCSKVGMTEQEKIVFSIAGAKHFDDRKKIYRFMLSNMHDDHRFIVSHQLCIQIFAEYLDRGKFTFDIMGNALLKDAIYSLGCKEMRLEHIKKGLGLNEDRDSECQPLDVLCSIARKAFLSQIVKNYYIENLMPIIVQLNHKLRELKSPLTRDLMLCLRELMMDYRNEVDEIISLDSELASEVALDLKYATAKDKELDDSEEYVNCNVSLKEIESQFKKMSEVVLDKRLRLLSVYSDLFQGHKDSESSLPSTSSPAAAHLTGVPSSSLGDKATDNESSQALTLSDLNEALDACINDPGCSKLDITDTPTSSQELEEKRRLESKPEKKTKTSSKSKRHKESESSLPSTSSPAAAHLTGVPSSSLGDKATDNESSQALTLSDLREALDACINDPGCSKLDITDAPTSSQELEEKKRLESKSEKKTKTSSKSKTKKKR